MSLHPLTLKSIEANAVPMVEYVEDEDGAEKPNG